MHLKKYSFIEKNYCRKQNHWICAEIKLNVPNGRVFPLLRIKPCAIFPMKLKILREYAEFNSHNRPVLCNCVFMFLLNDEEITIKNNITSLHEAIRLAWNRGLFWCLILIVLVLHWKVNYKFKSNFLCCLVLWLPSLPRLRNSDFHNGCFFAKAYALERHLLLSSAILWFSCFVCDSRFEITAHSNIYYGFKSGGMFYLKLFLLSCSVSCFFTAFTALSFFVFIDRRMYTNKICNHITPDI